MSVEKISEELNKQLENEWISFNFFNQFKFKVPEQVVITWGIMLFLMIFTIIFVRKLELVPKGKQNIVEVIVEFLYNTFNENMGEKGKIFIPYLSTVAIYLAIANVIGIFGIKSPTKDLNVTASLALLTILVVEFSGIYAKGVWGWFKSFFNSNPMVTFMNFLELFIRPLSLCMRLFGNILGAFVIMELIKIVAHPVIPVVFSLYFDIFDGLLQAYIFVFLASLFINEKMEHEEE